MNKKYENSTFDENNDHTLMIRSLYAFKECAEKSQINLMHLRKGVYTRQKNARDREHLSDYHQIVREAELIYAQIQELESLIDIRIADYEEKNNS